MVINRSDLMRCDQVIGFLALGMETITSLKDSRFEGPFFANCLDYLDILTSKLYY